MHSRDLGKLINTLSSNHQLVALVTLPKSNRPLIRCKRRGRTTKTWPTPYFLFQLFLSVSTQISPAFETFGWKIRVIIVPIISSPTTIRIYEGHTFRRQIRIFRSELKSDFKVSSFVWCPGYSSVSSQWYAEGQDAKSVA